MNARRRYYGSHRADGVLARIGPTGATASPHAELHRASIELHRLQLQFPKMFNAADRRLIEKAMTATDMRELTHRQCERLLALYRSSK